MKTVTKTEKHEEIRIKTMSEKANETLGLENTSTVLFL
jgi:hypothetical protein